MLLGTVGIMFLILFMDDFSGRAALIVFVYAVCWIGCLYDGVRNEIAPTASVNGRKRSDDVLRVFLRTGTVVTNSEKKTCDIYSRSLIDRLFSDPTVVNY